MNPILITALAVFVLFAFLLWLLVLPMINLWLQAFFSKADITFAEIVGMRFRKTDAAVIVVNKIRLLKAGIQTIDAQTLEILALAGGDVSNVVSAFIAADHDGKPLDWKALTSYNLAGRNPLDLVNDAIESGDYSDLAPLLVSTNPEIDSPQPAI